MIVILYEARNQEIARSISEKLQEAYHNQIQINLMQAETPGVWPSEPSWDDFIIVPFDSDSLCHNAIEFVQRELRVEGRSIAALPVALSPRHGTSPTPLQHIKALPFYDNENDLSGRLVRRVGALLGLRLRNCEQLIFISYRAADGAMLADQLEGFLKNNGYQVWRDESREEFDNETRILPGVDVQTAIQENLSRADMLLLLDTPRAAESDWIKLEVDWANGELIPILPVLILAPNERRKISRFRSLATLQRGCEFAARNGIHNNFTLPELDEILDELEIYLRDIFQRRLRVPFLVEKEFTSRGYDWTSRDRFIYEALRRHDGMLRTRVLSHCSYFEGIYDPALTAFIRRLDNARPRANYALYVYDGALVPPSQLEEVRQSARLDESTDIIILHHQEIAALLHTNFTSLRI